LFVNYISGGEAQLVVEDIPIAFISTTITIPDGTSTTFLKAEISKKNRKCLSNDARISRKLIDHYGNASKRGIN
jgi:hypothetical protein